MIGPLDPVETNLGFEAVEPAVLPDPSRIQVRAPAQRGLLCCCSRARL
jgi:hypothetical protein